jgi:hypothetical protein
MHHALKRQFQSLGIEILVYGVLITGYLLLVLRYLGGWLQQLFQHERTTYALVALGLVVAQGALLEGVTRLLLHFVRPESGPRK